MIDREKVLAVLVKRFPEARLADVAAAANAIVGLGPEYEVVPPAAVTAFKCDTDHRQYDAGHLERGDVRVYCRVAPR